MELLEQALAASLIAGLATGLGVAAAIAVHNVPEGLAVAEPLRRAGLAPWRCALIG
jgi:ZIP family zinc transporter